MKSVPERVYVDCMLRECQSVRRLVSGHESGDRSTGGVGLILVYNLVILV